MQYVCVVNADLVKVIKLLFETISDCQISNRKLKLIYELLEALRKNGLYMLIIAKPEFKIYFVRSFSRS